jgi:hypothetical protein
VSHAHAAEKAKNTAPPTSASRGARPAAAQQRAVEKAIRIEPKDALATVVAVLVFHALEA